MRLKRLLTLLAALLLIAVSAQADTWYVYTPNGKTLNLRSPETNAVIGNIPYGTKLETDNMRSTETAAYVTWGGQSGYVKWSFLVPNPPPARGGSKPTPAPASKQAQKPMRSIIQLLPADGEGDITVQTFGAYVEYNKNSTGKYSAISFDVPVKVKITADPPKGKSIDYWVIDGMRYDFKPRVPTVITLDNVTDSVIVEAVPKGQISYTLLTDAAIQSMRTGETLIVDTIHAKFCHIRADDKGAGGWIKEFDFTENFTNRATKRMETGGRVTVRVKAIIPSGKKISYWKFNDMKVKFNKNITEFIVRNLNVSKTYQPVFETVKTTTRPPRNPYQPPTLLAPGINTGN